MKDAVLLAPRALLQVLREDLLLLMLVLACTALSLWHPHAVATYPGLVDWPTIAALAGLILLTTGLEESSFLQHAAFHIITRMHTERHLALLLVVAMAALATARLVIFEALAANAGSVLTPVGNPQNLFLWHHSGQTFHAFVAEMLPLTVLLLGLLLAFAVLAFPAKTIETHEDIAPPALRRGLLAMSLALYPVFVVLVDRHEPYWALALVLGLYLVCFRPVVTKVDWALIAVFVLMFIDLRAIARLDAVQEGVAHLGLADPRRLFGAGIALSQVISNVPATILLAEHSADWRTIAYGVNVGGFGFLIGSLANIIALRLLGERRAWWVFHAYSLPYLALAAGLAWPWLFQGLP